MRKGFSLVELLVVIVIIAVLAAILFPVLAQAREKSRQVSCVNNQRQIYMTEQIYAQDKSGVSSGTVPMASGNLTTWLTSLNLPAGAMKCADCSVTPSYNMVADLSGICVLIVNPTCHPDCLFTADGAILGNGVGGIIFTQADIHTTLHSGKGFVGCFLDGHVSFINPGKTPLYDAIDLTHATTGSISYTGTTNINTILYQGARHLFTFDATAGTFADGQVFTSTPFVANVTLPALQYVALHVINVPPTNNTNNTATPTLIPVINIVTPTGQQANVVNFGTNAGNVLRNGMYYTFSLNPFAGSGANTVSAAISDNALTFTIN